MSLRNSYRKRERTGPLEKVQRRTTWAQSCKYTARGAAGGRHPHIHQQYGGRGYGDRAGSGSSSGRGGGARGSQRMTAPLSCRQQSPSQTLADAQAKGNGVCAWQTSRRPHTVRPLTWYYWRRRTRSTPDTEQKLSLVLSIAEAHDESRNRAIYTRD